VTTIQNHRASRVIRGTLLGAALSAAFVGAMPGSASADDSGDTTDANVAVLSGITMTGLSESFLLTGTPGQTVTTDDGDVTFNVETNNVAGYVVTVQSQDPTMLPADTVANVDFIPIADLKVAVAGSGEFQAVSSADPVLVHSHPGRSENGGDDLADDYRIRIPVVDADTYSATIDYVATTL
jgi:hypothetical protein